MAGQQQQHPLPTSLPLSRENGQCKLALHKYSARGIVADYRIELLTQFLDMDSVVETTKDLFTTVCELYTDYIFKARLVALCEYERFNNEGEIIARETYHHASGPSEFCSILTADNFYQQHMGIIANRIETFLRHGSSLRFVGYKHIHIAISVTQVASS